MATINASLWLGGEQGRGRQVGLEELRAWPESRPGGRRCSIPLEIHCWVSGDEVACWSNATEHGQAFYVFTSLSGAATETWVPCDLCEALGYFARILDGGSPATILED